MNPLPVVVPNISLEATLTDGSTVHIRLLTPEDREHLRAFFMTLSPESRRQRFFSSMINLSSKLLDQLASVDGRDTIGVIAERQGVIVGVGRAHRTDDQTAEVAFTVSDKLQGHGVGTVLLEVLAHLTHQVGFTQFVAITKAGNSSMLNVFRNTGFPTRVHHDPEDGSVMLIEIDIDERDPRFVSAHRLREHLSATRSLEPLLRPTSIAVFGDASIASAGERCLTERLFRHGYSGMIATVDETPKTVARTNSFSNVADIPTPIDLAIVMVPQPQLFSVIRECGEAGVRGVLVLGTGPSQHARIVPHGEEELASVVGSYGMRLIGPNSVGVVNTDAATNMYATIKDVEVTAGSLAFVTQFEGALNEAITLGRQESVGFSTLVSLGDNADVSANDFLEYFDSDNNTRVIALHLTNVGDPKVFVERARDIGTRKPIITIGPTLPDDQFADCGVIQVAHLGDLMTVASKLGSAAL